MVVSGRQWRELQRPYAAAIAPEIADRQVVLRPQLQADAEDASVLLSCFDAQVGARVVPLASIPLRSESASSSQIENLSSSARAVAESDLGERGDGNAALIVRNVRALASALDLADDLSDDTVVAMQRALLDDSAPDETGRYRTEQVWIGGNAVSPHRAFDVLVDRGIVMPGSSRKRNRVWVAADVTDALDRFAERARRHGRVGTNSSWFPAGGRRLACGKQLARVAASARPKPQHGPATCARGVTAQTAPC